MGGLSDFVLSETTYLTVVPLTATSKRSDEHGELNNLNKAPRLTRFATPLFLLTPSFSLLIRQQHRERSHPPLGSLMSVQFHEGDPEIYVEVHVNASVTTGDCNVGYFFAAV